MRLSDERLDFLLKLYAPTVVPPCRVCGGDMGIGSVGGGEPTVWFCNHAFDAGRSSEAWDHYGKSEFVDRRQGGDEYVCALVAEVRALRAVEEPLGMLLGMLDTHDDGDGCVSCRHYRDKLRAALAGVRTLGEGEKP